MFIPRRSAVFLGFLLATAACSSNASTTSAAKGRAREPIVHGIPSDASQDAVVLFVHDGGGANVDYCTGTLVAPNLVLTARHCVSTTGDAGFSCGADGIGSPEGAVGADFPPESLGIYVGVNLPADTDPPAAVGKQIFHDGAKNLCNHDLALVLLDKAVPGAKLAALRLGDTTKPGELVTTVGWGVTDTTFDPETRMQRTGVAIKYVGQDVDHDIPSNQFEVGESICDGDSGGPALSAAGAIVGIVSSGANDNPDPDADVPGSGCVDPGAANDFTKVASFSGLIASAFEAAGATPLREGETPTTDAGPTSDAAGTDTGTSGDGDVILPGDAGTTAPASTNSSSGCSTSGARGTDVALAPLGMLLAAAAIVSRRRRHSSC